MFFDSVLVSLLPAWYPIVMLSSPVVNPLEELSPITTFRSPPTSSDDAAPLPIIILSSFWGIKDPDIVNEPVIWASPVNGNGSVIGKFVNWEPSPKYVPNDAV